MASPAALAAFVAVHACSCSSADRSSPSSSRAGRSRCSPRPNGSPARSSGRRCGSTRCAARPSSPSTRSSTAAARLWRRYVRIGLGLLLMYALTAAVYLAFVFGGYALAGNSGDPARLDRGRCRGVERADRLDHAAELLLPDDADGRRHRGRQRPPRRAAGARRSSGATCAKSRRVFGVVLIVVVIATAASILATAGLGLIAFVPLVGLAVLPLQLAAWLHPRHRLRVPGAGRARRVSVALPLVPSSVAPGHPIVA